MLQLRCAGTQRPRLSASSPRLLPTRCFLLGLSLQRPPNLHAVSAVAEAPLSPASPAPPPPMKGGLRFVKKKAEISNLIKLAGEAQDIVIAAVPELVLSFVLQTKELGQFVVQLRGPTAELATKNMPVGAHVAVSGKLAVGDNGQLYIEGSRVSRVRQKQSKDGGPTGIAAAAALLKSGLPLDAIAAQTGWRPEFLAHDLITFCRNPNNGVPLSSIVPHVFNAPGGLELDELTSFVRNWLQQNPSPERGKDGRIKVVPVREALLQSPELRNKVVAQEASVRDGIGMTFNQVRIVLSGLDSQPTQAKKRPALRVPAVRDSKKAKLMASAFKSGSSLDDIAAQLGERRDYVTRDLILYSADPANDLPLSSIMPLVFYLPGGLEVDEVASFVRNWQQQNPQPERGSDGSVKLSPIRKALLSSSELGDKVVAQEAQVAEGPGVTYNQIRVALALV